MKTYILFNPKAGGCSEDKIKGAAELARFAGREYVDVTGIASYSDFFAGLAAEDVCVLCGGDGTIHRFVNDIKGITIKNDIFYYPAGTGNDFMNDVKDAAKDGVIRLNPYIEHLPSVTVKDVTKLFINNVGFGIDGYCCEVGDDLRDSGVEKINYTSIAIKGLLGGFKRVNATITADGVTKTYKNVWLAPSMNGRFYGGGMMAAPSQDRLNPEHTVSLMVMFCPFKLKTLIVFPSIFKGEHVKHKEMVEEFKAKNIHVKFDRPTALQIDGETYRGVTEYTVVAG